MMVTKQFRAEIAHRLMRHEGKCKNIHGHSYLFEISIWGTPNPQTGMVMDFKQVKAAIEEIIGDWDHGLLLEQGDPLIDIMPANSCLLFVTDGPPTAEWMAEYIGRSMRQAVCRVRVWETTTSYAEWRRGE